MALEGREGGKRGKSAAKSFPQRRTDRCKEIISVSKPHEPFDRSFQPFSPSVSASRFAETSARSRSPVVALSFSLSRFSIFLLSLSSSPSRLSCTLQNEFCLEIKSRERKRPSTKKISGQAVSFPFCPPPNRPRCLDDRPRFPVSFSCRFCPLFPRGASRSSSNRQTFRKRFFVPMFAIVDKEVNGETSVSDYF